MTQAVPPTKFLNGYVEGKDLFLLYRDAQQRRMARRVPAEWSAFIKKAIVPIDLLRELKTSSCVAGVREEGEFLRILWADESWRRKAHGRDGFFAELGLETFEADISPVRRFFSETGAFVGVPRRCYLDIETDSRVPPAVARQGKARVLCWSLSDDEGATKRQARTVARGVLEADTDEAERKLLEGLFAAIEPYDQVAAWFGDLFDFPVIKARVQRVSARVKDPRRWLWMDFAEVYDRMNRPAAESGDEKTSRALEFVAREVLGEGKDDFDARKTWEAWEAGGEERARMARYCDKDTTLLARLEAKTGYLALNASVCEVCRVFSDTDSATPATFVDGWMLRMGVERGMRFPNKPWSLPDADRKKFSGAWVLEPQVKGIRKNVHVVDFSGMYPSIIQTWNMSPETIAPINVNGPIPPGHSRAPSTRVGFRTDVVGLLSEAVAEMKRLRKFWSTKQGECPPGSSEWWEAARRSATYKVIVNIFYGIAGSPHSRYSDVRVAESVSTTGVWLIQKTIHASEGSGMFAIYSDTDSAFFENAPSSPALTYQGIADFVARCNKELYPQAVREVGCVENYIDLAYEKVFERLVLVSKKAYCAVYSSYKGTATCECDVAMADGELKPGSVDVRTMTCRDCGRVWGALPLTRGKPEIRGLEYRRGDTNRIARRLQKMVIDMLMLERIEDPAKFVPVIEAMREQVLTGPLPVDDVSNAQALTKSLREYDKGKKLLESGKEQGDTAHVQVAKILRSRGEQMVEGVKVAYVVVDGACSPMRVIPAVDYQGECDRYYLWEKRIYPATQRVLDAAFPALSGMSADELRERDWDRFLKVRPRKERGKGGVEFGEPPPKHGVAPRKALPAEQVGLFAAPIVVAAAPARQDGPYAVDVPKARLLAVRAALRAYPGTRPVDVTVVHEDGTRVPFPVSTGVAVCPEFVRAVEKAIGNS